MTTSNLSTAALVPASQGIPPVASTVATRAGLRKSTWVRLPRALEDHGAREPKRAGTDDEHLLARLRIGPPDALQRGDHGLDERGIPRG